MTMLHRCLRAGCRKTTATVAPPNVAMRPWLEKLTQEPPDISELAPEADVGHSALSSFMPTNAAPCASSWK
jgi:hypothetical protein